MSMLLLSSSDFPEVELGIEDELFDGLDSISKLTSSSLPSRM